MGEQPGPVEDELERALVSMRAGFLSGANQIAAEIASLEEHLADAPDRERDSVGAAITQIVNAQARLTARMEALPAAAWDRFKAMVSIVKAQQGVLDQLGDVVQKHVLPRQLENLSISPLPEPPQPVYSPEAGAADYSDYNEPEAEPEPEPQGESFLRAHTALQALHAAPPRKTRIRTARRARDDFGAEDDEPRSLFARMRERTAGYKGLAAMIIAAVALGMMQRDVKPQDLAAKVVAMVSGAIDAARSAGPKEAPPATTAASQPPAERVQLHPEERPTAPEPVAPSRTASAAPLDVAPAAGRAEPTAQAQPDEAHVAVAPVAAAERAAPPPAAGEEQFVPVVFTHKDYDTVLQALSDLKQRFPNLLIGRRGEVQPVDLGRKGIWHRLVLLPAGTRPEATRLCDQMMAQGYDRCWVKAY
jgi:hypothetical protein